MELTEFSRASAAGRMPRGRSRGAARGSGPGPTVRLERAQAGKQGYRHARRVRSVAFKQGGPLAGRRLRADRRGPRALGSARRPSGRGTRRTRSWPGSPPARATGSGTRTPAAPARQRAARSSLKVKWDAEGTDGRNVNGEFIRDHQHRPGQCRLARRLVGARRVPSPVHVPGQHSRPGRRVDRLRSAGGRTAPTPSSGASGGPVFENVERRAARASATAATCSTRRATCAPGRCTRATSAARSR